MEHIQQFVGTVFKDTALWSDHVHACMYFTIMDMIFARSCCNVCSFFWMCEILFAVVSAVSV